LTQAAGPNSPNGELVAAMCRAWNDFMVEEWFARGDERLFATIFVPTHDPEEGAKELRRAAARHPRFAAAHMFLAIGKPFGNAIYDPIYEAMCDTGVTMYVHGATGEIGGGAPPLAGGAVMHFRLEMFASLHHPMSHHLTSMVAQGTFEKFPQLRVVVAEQGIAWLPWFLTSIESSYELLRRESRWIKRRPTEYLRERLAVSTQPIEASLDDRDRLVEFLATVEGIEDMLCFSSDYPHWDADEPTFVGSILPGAWHDKVFYGNARRLLARLPDSLPTTPPALAAAG
jgi:predicted TIM-barrel fold metal-dependent hydrolase